MQIESAEKAALEMKEQHGFIKSRLTPNKSILLDRFCSGEPNKDNLQDESDRKGGRCRWCGTRSGMPDNYPRDGRALVHRCCSAFCQVLFASYSAGGRGYFSLPQDNKGEIDFDKAAELLAEHDVTLHRRKYPIWFESKETEGAEFRREQRYCAYVGIKKHLMPSNASKKRIFCDQNCRREARLDRLKVAYLGNKVQTLPNRPSKGEETIIFVGVFDSGKGPKILPRMVRRSVFVG
jgi:hypothetical protein